MVELRFRIANMGYGQFQGRARDTCQLRGFMIARHVGRRMYSSHRSSFHASRLVSLTDGFCHRERAASFCTECSQKQFAELGIWDRSIGNGLCPAAIQGQRSYNRFSVSRWEPPEIVGRGSRNRRPVENDLVGEKASTELLRDVAMKAARVCPGSHERRVRCFRWSNMSDSVGMVASVGEHDPSSRDDRGSAQLHARSPSALIELLRRSSKDFGEFPEENVRCIRAMTAPTQGE